MRLIDADRLLRRREDHEMISTHLIFNAPTVDAVEVVRCKDCKWHTDRFCGNFNVIGFTNEDYCSLAERGKE